MQRVATQIPPTIFETFPRTVQRSKPTYRLFQSSPTAFAAATMASQPSFQEYKIENTDVPAAPGQSLNDSQKVITGSVLDLFAGRPSLRKLNLWKDDASFVDPLTIAEGRKQYAAQWYGLAAVFSKIERLGGQVTSAGNPIELQMKNKYTVKGLGSEQTIDSVIKIFTEGEGANMRITKVEDRWNDNLPDGPFKNAMRNLNSVVVPTMVKVPKSIEEEEGKA